MHVSVLELGVVCLEECVRWVFYRGVPQSAGCNVFYRGQASLRACDYAMVSDVDAGACGVPTVCEGSRRGRRRRAGGGVDREDVSVERPFA